jgi:hypothetical protein
MTTFKATAVVLDASTLMLVEGPGTLAAARKLVGQSFMLPTLAANETALYRVESVSQNRETGDVFAWVVRRRRAGGRHVRVVSRV